MYKFLEDLDFAIDVCLILAILKGWYKFAWLGKELLFEQVKSDRLSYIKLPVFDNFIMKKENVGWFSKIVKRMARGTWEIQYMLSKKALETVS